MRGKIKLNDIATLWEEKNYRQSQGVNSILFNLRNGPDPQRPDPTGHKLTDVVRILGVKRASIKQAVVKGKTISDSDNYPVLLEKRT